MATHLQIPITSSVPPPSSSSPYLRRRSTQTLCCINNRNGAKFPVPPVNPNYRNVPLVNTKDTFLPKRASVSETMPEKLLSQPSNSDLLPFMDSFDSPTAMAAAPASVGRSARYNRRMRKKSSPPDMASKLLEQRIVYIDLPFVSMVTELLIAQLMYLELKDPDQPITLHISSSGTTMDDETVARETEGFAIYDALRQLRCEVRTIAYGDVIGAACLLLAAGTKGKRYMFPHATAMIQQPEVPPTGYMQTSAVDILTKEVLTHKDTFVELLAKHTGQSVETIAKDIQVPFHMDCMKAKEYGVIDKIIWRGQEKMMESAPPEYWTEKAVRK